MNDVEVILNKKEQKHLFKPKKGRQYDNSGSKLI